MKEIKTIAFYKSGSAIDEPSWITEFLEPESETVPNVDCAGGIIVIVHASQSPENSSSTNDNRKKYECFDACIKALTDGDESNDNFKNHQGWLKHRRSFIKGIVLTSGDPIYDRQIITNAQSLLNAKSKADESAVPVEFVSVSNLKKLKKSDDLMRVLQEQDFREIALQTLIALFPYRESPSRLNTLNADSNYEDFLSARLNSYLLGEVLADPNTTVHSSKIIKVSDCLLQSVDKLNRWDIDERSVPHNLDKFIRLLSDTAKRKDLDRNQKEFLWNKYLRALRSAMNDRIFINDERR